MKLKNYMNFIKTIKNSIKKLNFLFEQEIKRKNNKINVDNLLANDLKDNKILLAKILTEIQSKNEIKKISEAEFQVFSQWGDDGIIQFLIRTAPSINHSFIEFGVENYRESNTRYLLINNLWRGLVIDGDLKNIEYIKNDYVSWSNDLTPVHAFITRENINFLLEQNNFVGDIGILSIDVDGNDYWIWDSIEIINPAIVIVEYNSLFGRFNSFSIPYQSDFKRGSIDSFDISYYGCSLNALKYLGKKKGYDFLGCNSNGNNAYFVRKDMSYNFASILNSDIDGFVLCSFNECKISNERIKGIDRIKILNGKKIINVENNYEGVISFSDSDIINDHYLDVNLK
ncbi:MAG: hypothetical protein K9I82_16720 [Chitinophagaceae bacterium]|nr:hypothetical protein [Chitinophagaceae bacterium]